jgi:diketogulonate reductase-like aldo/keto reductase
MPALGLGVFQSKPEETTDAVVAYMNERGAGEGLRRAEVDRADIFMETKIWITDYGFDSALRAFDASLRKLATCDCFVSRLLRNSTRRTRPTRPRSVFWLMDACVRSACRTSLRRDWSC